MFLSTSLLSGFLLRPSNSVSPTSLPPCLLPFYRYCANRDTSYVNNMNSLIYTYCSSKSIFDGDVSAWDVSSVTNMFTIFREAIAFNQQLNAWDVSRVIEMSFVFYKAGAFNQALAAWDVSSVTSMRYMFDNADIFNQALATWDISMVTFVTGMFWSANAFNQDLASWDMSSVANMGSMFNFARAFNQALGAWDVSSVNDMGNMFYDAASFNQILCWNMTRIPNTENMFQGSGTTYAAAIDNPACPLTANPTLLPSSSPTFPPSHLVTPITNSTSLRTAVTAWCNNSETATEIYGDISIWCLQCTP